MWNNQSEQGPSSRNEKRMSLKRGGTTFRRKGEILQSWRDTRVVNMISTIHDSTMVDVPRRNEVKKKPICIFQYNMFMKGVDRADQYLSYYSLLRKTVKWPKKVAFWLINCALFNSFRIYQKLNPTSNMRYKEFLLQVAKDWAADKVETDSDTDAACPGTSTQTPRVPHEDPPGRLSGDMRKHVLEKTVGSEWGKRKYPARRCHVCAAHKKRSETRTICKFCLVPLHKGECFQRYHTLKHY